MKEKYTESIRFYRTFVHYHDLHSIVLFYGIKVASSIDSDS
jgi:hypothetical protein